MRCLCRLAHPSCVLPGRCGVEPNDIWPAKVIAVDVWSSRSIHISLNHRKCGCSIREKKIAVASDGRYAAFNTGLVDRRYESIYALFDANHDEYFQSCKLVGFCVAGEGSAGQNLVRYFRPLPAAAHYFDDPAELIYDVRAGEPEMNLQHIIIENIGRFPFQFLEDNCPKGFELRNPSSSLTTDTEYYRALGRAVEEDERTYRAIMNRFKDAVALSIKRIAWNFKTAIPQYYPRLNVLSLLLPICLVSDDTVDMALIVEKTPSGNYLGHTVIPLDWAYQNARLICRPDSDWLVPSSIAPSASEVEPD